MIHTKLRLSLFPTALPIFRVFNQTVSPSTSKINVIENVRNKLQYCTTSTQKMQSKKLVKSKSDSVEKNEFNAVIDYIKHTNLDLVKKIPRRYLTRKKVLKEMFLVDESAIQNFISLIIDDLLKNTSFVIEINPGFGLLTQALLNNNVPTIHACKELLVDNEPLKELQNKYPNRLYLERFDFLHFQKEIYRDEVTKGNIFNTMFKGIQCKDWKGDTCMQVIGVIPDILFIKHLIIAIMTQSGIISFGRPVFYFALPPSLWMILTATSASGYFLYRHTSVIFQLMFNYNLLGALPRQAFLPWKRNINPLSNKRNIQYKLLDNVDMYIVKIEPKVDLYDDFTNVSSIQQFCYFIRHHLQARSNRIIPALEKWISGCGANLVMQNYDVFTEFGDLSPEQLLRLFKDFSSWPGFEKSSFHSYVDKWQRKVPRDLETESNHHVDSDHSEETL